MRRFSRLRLIILILTSFSIVYYNSVRAEELTAAELTAAELTAEEIIRRVDSNQAPDSLAFNGIMIINRQGELFEKKFSVFGRGRELSFMEFYEPARDRGTRYLRQGKNLWMYLPRAERTVKIAGHMLRQSMMGSDFSYEDQTEQVKLAEDYIAELISSSADSWQIELTARQNAEVTYYRQLIEVERENFLVKRAEMYGRSGRLLKEMNLLDYEEVEPGRYYMKRIRMEDKIRGDSFTEVSIEDLRLNIEIEDQIFSLGNLERRTLGR